MDIRTQDGSPSNAEEMDESEQMVAVQGEAGRKWGLLGSGA